MPPMPMKWIISFFPRLIFIKSLFANNYTMDSKLIYTAGQKSNNDPLAHIAPIQIKNNFKKKIGNSYIVLSHTYNGKKDREDFDLSGIDNLGILSSTDSGANLDLYDDDTRSRIRTVDGRLHIYADFLNQVADSEIRFFVDNALKGAISAGSSFSLDNDPDTFLGHPAANTLTLTTNGSEALRINSSGNVGLGTDTISGKLHLSARTGDCKLIIEADKFQDSGSEANNPYILFRQDGGSDMSAVGNNLFDSGSDHNALYLSNSSGSGGIIFTTGTSNGYTNSTERARFYKSGEFLVGIKTSRSMGCLLYTSDAADE